MNLARWESFPDLLTLQDRMNRISTSRISDSTPPLRRSAGGSLLLTFTKSPS